MQGEPALAADAELLSVAISSMLAIEAEEIDVRLGHGSLNMDVKGEISALEAIEEERDELDDLLAVSDLLDGYGLAKFISVDLTQKTACDGVCFACYAGKNLLAQGGRRGAEVVFTVDLPAVLQYKLGGKELKDPVPVVLVASDLADTAYQVAFGLRRQGLKAEGFVSGGSMIDAEEYCALKGIPTLVWAGEEKVIMKNIQSGETAETTLDKLLGK